MRIYAGLVLADWQPLTMSRMLRHQNSSVCRSRGTPAVRLLCGALACGLLLCQAGCRIPGLCCPDAGPVLPETYNGVTTPDNSADVGIIEFFSDPVLSGLIVQGLVNNLELKIRNQEIWIANNQVQAAR